MPLQRQYGFDGGDVEAVDDGQNRRRHEPIAAI